MPIPLRAIAGTHALVRKTVRSEGDRSANLPRINSSVILFKGRGGNSPPHGLAASSGRSKSVGITRIGSHAPTGATVSNPTHCVENDTLWRYRHSGFIGTGTEEIGTMRLGAYGKIPYVNRGARRLAGRAHSGHQIPNFKYQEGSPGSYNVVLLRWTHVLLIWSIAGLLKLYGTARSRPRRNWCEYPAPTGLRASREQRPLLQSRIGIRLVRTFPPYHA
jgi:hypothetical protein